MNKTCCVKIENDILEIARNNVKEIRLIDSYPITLKDFVSHAILYYNDVLQHERFNSDYCLSAYFEFPCTDIKEHFENE